MESLEERVARLERQVAELQRYLGVDPALVPAESSHLPPDFYQALRRGKKVLAIKIYREVTGASLVTAKKKVDEMARQAR
jgi:ribosomal protein L7/L12